MTTARTAAALFAAACAVAWGAAVATRAAEPEPEDCPLKSAPSGLTLETKDFGGTDRWVEIEWTPWDPAPSYDTTHYEFVRWEVQRKAPGGEFAELPPGDAGWGLNPDSSVGYALNYVRDPGECAGTCALPGGTYAYRVRAHYKFRDICLQFDGSTLTTGFSNEASITVPGGAPAGPQPPENVIAVGHTKKRQVDVTWKASAEKPDHYVVKRRLVSEGPDKAPRAGGGLEVVGRASRTATKFTDRRIQPDAVYAYLVEAVASNVAAPSPEDLAYALAGKFRSASYREVPGEYACEIDGVPATVVLDSTADGGTVAIETTQVQELSGITLDGTLGALGTRPLPKKSSVIVSTVEEVGVPAWAGDLVVGHTGKLSLAYTQRDRFDPLAFRTLEARLLIRPGAFPKVDEAFQMQLLRWDAAAGLEVPRANLYASCAAGNTGPVPHTGKVIVVYRLLNLGPAPLFSRRLNMLITVTNGEFVGGLGSEWFEFVDSYVNDDGNHEAAFRVGALGPVTRTKGEIATLVFQVEADVPLGQDVSQTGIEIQFTTGAAGAEDQDVEVRAAARRIEIAAFRPAVPAKR